jgi:hypothetical protein
MKKIITLLFCVGAFATSFAQYNSGYKDDRYAYNENKHFGGNFSPKDKEFQIEKINRDFDFKIHAIQNSWNLGRHQKKVIIRNLQKEKSRQIQMVNVQFHDRRRDYNNQWHGR